jgi:protein kinase C substrate 80K-H
LHSALTRARAALSEAETALRNDKSSHETAITDLRDLFSPTKFGTQGEWKKLYNTCLTHDAGEYTYEVCLFEEAKQKPGPGKGGGTFSLGRFEG